MLRLLLLVIFTRMASSLFDEKLNAMYLTMPHAEFAKYFNKQNYSWKMSEEPNNISFSGCWSPNHEVRKTMPTKRYSLEDIQNAPESFDARTQWPKCESIRQIYDQGKCGSCWTFGSATTASDRTCIHKDVHVFLSEQDLECCKTDVCDGGSNEEALNFWQSTGLVTQECKPYNIDKLHQDTCTKKCVNSSIDYNTDKHFASEVYNVGSDIKGIKAELSQSGPITAGMTVYADLIHYHGGIYEHKVGDFEGLHSVRIIGYGVENGTSYWLVANSWGKKWGESGFFRIKQGAADVEIEKSLVTGKP